jgi:L-serine deaminase
VQNYDPEVPPSPAEWLALDEQLRIDLAEVYHRKAREKVPNVKAHAAFHAIVENQIAEGMESVVRAMARLMKQGLSRHDAVHAVGSCVADHVFEAMNSKDEDFASTAQVRYNAAVERLTAEEWKRKYE